MGTFNDHPRGVQPSGWKRGTPKGDDMVCSIWKHIAVRKNGDGLANRPEHKVKRACFKLGIGRELYTAPRIWVYSDKCTMKQLQSGRYQCFDSFSVSSITIEDHRIEQLEIVNDGTGQVAFQWASPAFVQKAMEEANAAPSKEQLFELTELVTKIAEAKNVTNDVVLKGLRESSPMRAVGMRDNRVETAAQAEAGINQLKIWLETVERSK